jgi:hypothetical protein
MQPVEQQIKILANKVDDVYQILDRLHHHLVLDPTGNEPSAALAIDQELSLTAAESMTNVVDVYNSADWLVHQDVLVDNQGVEASHHHTKIHLSPQSQIQRLTAQLTVAYGRIAALEEQLLSQRLS